MNIKKYLKQPLKILIKLDNLRFINLTDKQKINIKYRVEFKKKLNLHSPCTFNEKLQWLKLYDRNPEYTKMVDKYEAKRYVADIIGQEFIIPTLGVYDKFDEIDFDKLPEQFVIKCTHDSGGIIICKDKSKLDIKKAKNKINRSLKTNYYYAGREWPYKNVKPRIIIEKYMTNNDGTEIKDYKFFTFNGEPKLMYVSEGSHTEYQQIAFFDMNYNQQNIKRRDYNNFKILPEKPINFNLMISLSKKLAKNIPHLRVDFYEIDKKVYFGELTFYTGSGFIPFEDEEWNRRIGEWIKLPSTDLKKEGKYNEK